MGFSFLFSGSFDEKLRQYILSSLAGLSLTSENVGQRVESVVGRVGGGRIVKVQSVRVEQPSSSLVSRILHGPPLTPVLVSLKEKKFSITKKISFKGKKENRVGLHVKLGLPNLIRRNSILEVEVNQGMEVSLHLGLGYINPTVISDPLIIPYRLGLSLDKERRVSGFLVKERTTPSFKSLSGVNVKNTCSKMCLLSSETSLSPLSVNVIKGKIGVLNNAPYLSVSLIKNTVQRVGNYFVVELLSKIKARSSVLSSDSSLYLRCLVYGRAGAFLRIRNRVEVDKYISNRTTPHVGVSLPYGSAEGYFVPKVEVSWNVLETGLHSIFRDMEISLTKEY